MLGIIMNYGLWAVGIVLTVAGWLFRRGLSRRTDAEPKDLKKKKIGANILLIVGLWCLTERILQLLFGTKEAEAFSVSIWAPRMQIGGITISSTVVVTWAVMAVVFVLALLIRIFVIPRMTDEPHGIQNVLEICVEFACKYTHSSVGDLGTGLPAYIFTIALFMVGCAAVELLGIPAPTSDITMTFAMALITFFLINYYGIKKKGVLGRIKTLAEPTPVVFPIEVVSQLAVPVSLACRLFGNMLGGMIVMDLLYSAMSNAAIGFPSVLGLYFNVFHPLIQTYIFITLTLTFIREAAD